MQRRLGQADVDELRMMLIGESASMRALRRNIQLYGGYNVPVSVRGATGSGKDLVARGIHLSSRRARQPFVAVNCATLQPDLAGSTLFGHTRGGFTGATSMRRGLFSEASGGTLFLDEVAELSAEVQAMLLRVLESGEVRAVGADKGRSVDVRVIVATHAPLEDLVAQGIFRQDLYYRLSVAEIAVPPLSERTEDIPLLVGMLLSKGRKAYGLRSPGVDAGAMGLLMSASWPGNVRQLRNIVSRASILAGASTISGNDVQRALGASVALSRPGLTRKVQRNRRAEVLAALTAVGGNKTLAAERLGISRSTLYQHMKRHGIEA